MPDMASQPRQSYYARTPIMDPVSGPPTGHMNYDDMKQQRPGSGLTVLLLAFVGSEAGGAIHVR